MKKFTKIFQLGHKAIEDIWSGDVEVTEKIDGSQFRFRINEKGEPETFSKGTQIFHPTTDKLFQPGVEYVNSIIDRLPNGYSFYSETLCRPKHNTLVYESVPKNNIALFGVYDEEKGIFLDYSETAHHADVLGVDVVPIIDKLNGGMQQPLNYINDILDNTVSYLGGPKIEGVVVRNVHRAVEFHGILFPMMIGKYVSEKFKEKHEKHWKRKKSKNSWLDFMEQYRTEAHWEKVFQHLRDDGKLIYEPKDIGLLIKECQIDIEDEYKDEILEHLWKTFGKDLLRHSIKGLPEWYKEKLLKEDSY